MLANTPCDHRYVMCAVAAMQEYGDVVRCDALARSILGREIPMLTLGRGERTVVYVGAHHGMEWITSGVLLDFVADYIRQYQQNATLYDMRMSYLFSEYRIIVIPMLNPDGVEYVLHGVAAENPIRERVLAMNGSEDLSRWQANARGVDLNHNYNAGFAEYKIKEQEAGIVGGGPTRYSGEYPESEPESAAICRLLRYYREELCGVLTLHTQGEEIYCSCKDHLSAKSMAVGRILQRVTGYRLARPEGLSAFGGLTDWCIAELGRPSYTLECGRGENPLPLAARPLIYERLRRALFSFPMML
ncbi:MAG: gamma-D-glutamyl-meso-diaminopimelate peptidase [Ruminococcaceae bacterium]|nr:gamma-D-glutamyl-meso-diaminopimelate peptidase [Oscillospiraceae bacterium]